MQANEWEKISSLLDRALALPAARRQAYLAEIARLEGEAISDEVKALLQADLDSDGFLGTDALGLAARQLADNAQPGERILENAKYGNYRILTKLGAGGMGEVYLALDETLGRRVALKFLPHLFMQDQVQLARFEREARAASALNHPNILTVYEIGRAQGRAFIATEYVEGRTLRATIAERNLSYGEILKIAEQIGAALDAAHVAGLIHRDIKPDNIMLRPDGYVKILDFGLAKPVRETEESTPLFNTSLRQQKRQPRQHTQEGVVLGTPGYMSPEQANGETLDARSDLWSFGATLYEMLTGSALSAGASTARPVGVMGGPAMVDLITNGKHRLFRPILKKALAKERNQRYQSAREFLVDIDRAKMSSAGGKQKDASARPKRLALIAFSLFIVSSFGLILWREVAQEERPADSRYELDRGRISEGELYWKLSPPEKMDFIREAAQNIAKMLGENPSAHTHGQLSKIKYNLETYVVKRNSLSTDPGRESIKATYARASVYAPFIIDAFSERDLPPILGLYIAMNETEYHPCTESMVGAKGLFSFMPATAQRYGLRLAPSDDRCDPRKIAHAAARYLEDLTKLYGRDADSLTLAMLAYNWGETRVSRAVAELEAKNIHPINFWTLLENNARLSIPMTSESQNYAPRFFAAAILGETPQRFGLETQRLSAYTASK
jgi:serine/threonine protein kinase